jgi:hypothetical protein
MGANAGTFTPLLAMKIKVDKICIAFIKTAIIYQLESGVIFENDSSDKEFFECYGFSRQDLEKSLKSLRPKLGGITMRERINEGKFSAAIAKAETV